MQAGSIGLASLGMLAELSEAGRTGSESTIAVSSRLRQRPASIRPSSGPPREVSWR